jgi:hypothetical protein
MTLRHAHRENDPYTGIKVGGKVNHTSCFALFIQAKTPFTQAEVTAPLRRLSFEVPPSASVIGWRPPLLKTLKS